MDSYYITKSGVILHESEVDDFEDVEEVYFCEDLQKWRYVNCDQ